MADTPEVVMEDLPSSAPAELTDTEKAGTTPQQVAFTPRSSGTKQAAVGSPSITPPGPGQTSHAQNGVTELEDQPLRPAWLED
jgi:hypothetical protein